MFKEAIFFMFKKITIFSDERVSRNLRVVSEFTKSDFIFAAHARAHNMDVDI